MPQWAKLTIILTWVAVLAFWLSLSIHYARGSEPPTYLEVWGAKWCATCRAMEVDLAVLKGEDYPISERDYDQAIEQDKQRLPHLPVTYVCAGAQRRWCYPGRLTLPQLRAVLARWNIQRFSR